MHVGTSAGPGRGAGIGVRRGAGRRYRLTSVPKPCRRSGRGGGRRTGPRCRPRTRAPGCACPSWRAVSSPSRRRRRTARDRTARSMCSSSHGSRNSIGTVICLAASIRASCTKTPPKTRGGDPGFDRRQRQPDRGAQRHAAVADRRLGADLGQRLQGVQGRLPFRHGTLRQRDVVVDDDRADRLARRPRLLDRARPTRSSCALRGRSPCPGASMAATVNPQVVTLWWARATSPGAFLCMPPPWPISTRGARSAPDAGDQSTPGTSPTVKSRSTTPFDDVSAVNARCIGVAFRECLVVEALPATPTSIARP